MLLICQQIDETILNEEILIFILKFAGQEFIQIYNYIV